MSRDYQRLKNNPYYLQRPLYRMTLAFIRDHERKVSEYNALAEASPPPSEGQIRSFAAGSPTERAGIKRAEMRVAIDAVNEALALVPPEYRKGVWESVAYYKRYPDDASKSTYARHKQHFIYQVARNMYWV